MKKQLKVLFITLLAFINCIGLGIYNNYHALDPSYSSLANDKSDTNQTSLFKENENEINTITYLPVSSVTYNDNKGYQDSVVANSNIALGKSWLNLRINTNSPAIAVENKGNDVYVIDSSIGDGKSLLGNIVIEANYNFETTKNIADRHWDLSYDSAKNILGFNNLGIVGTGAFFVETSYDGQTYNETSSALNTVNVTDYFSPSAYNESNGNFKVVYQPSGNDINKGIYIRIRFAYEIYQTTYSYYDKTLKEFVDNSFEHPNTTNHSYSKLNSSITYYNILETATFYFANNSGVVGFHNLTNNIEKIKDHILDNYVSQVYATNKSKKDHIETEFEIKYSKYINNEKDEHGNKIILSREEKISYYNSNTSLENYLNDQSLTTIAQQYSISETLNDGDMTLSGFSLDNLGNNKYTVRYALNGQDKGQMKNGELFLESGRYDIYVSTPWKIDKSHYTIYVNPRDESAVLNDYFDTNFISSGSKRIYDLESKIPVFVKGSINYQIKNSLNEVPLSGKIVKYADDKEDPLVVYTFLYNEPVETQNGLIILNKNANNTGMLNLDEGYYLATFYTTTDFTDGITGDYYSFSYFFKVVDETEVVGPVVNQSILESSANISRFKSKYYGVEQTNINNKVVTFAFNYYEDARNFAYEIEKNKVVFKDGKYLYNNVYYNNANLLSKAINETICLIVKTKYFDASDIYSYLTISEQLLTSFVSNNQTEAGVDILNLPYVTEDIVVVLSSEQIEKLKTNIPFLNDGLIAVLEDDGSISQTKSSLNFISVADYESKSIKAINMQTGQSYILNYGSNVEEQLIDQRATSGKYKIVESNLYGDKSSDTSEYYAIYIAQENTSKAQITYLLNGEINHKEINISENEVIIKANSLVIENICNELDPYSIVKILYNGEVNIMSIYELSNYKIDKTGNYQVEIVDRLGNILTFTINISNPVEAVILKYNDNTTQTAFVGINSELKLDLTKENYDFKGWYYEGLNKEYITSIIPTSNASLELSPVWYHTYINITWIDGDFIETTKAKPEDTIDFDSQKFNKNGYNLVGFMWSHDQKSTLFTYKISSVPNVEEMSITAIYKKAQSSLVPNGITLVDGDNITYNATAEESFPEIGTVEGMTFIGWMELGPIGGTIYKEKIPNLEGDVILTAIYYTTPTLTDSNQENNFWAKYIGRISSIGKGIAQYGIFFLLIALFPIIAKAFRKKQRKVYVSNNTLQIQEHNEINHIFKIEEKKENTLKEIQHKSNARKKKIRRNKFKLFKLKYLTIATCMLLALIFSSQGICFDVAKIRADKLTQSQYSQCNTLQEDNYKNLNTVVEKIKSSHSHSVKEISQSENDYKEKIQETNKLVSSSVSNTEFTINDAEAFLYSNVIIDLTTLGYEVFLAKVIFNNQTVYGIAYTTGESYYENVKEKDVVYLSTGFTAFLHQEPITQYAIEQGLTIVPLEDRISDDEIEIKYVLGFEESYLNRETNTINYNHYISNNEYVHYAIYDFSFHATFTPITDWNEIENIFDLNAGEVYSYDDEFIVFDPSWKKDEIILNKILASGINNNSTKDQNELFFNSFIDIQDDNLLTIESGTYIYFSPVNLNEVYLGLQQEAMFDVSADQWREIEDQLEEGVYYYLTEKQETNEEGELLWLDQEGNKTTTDTGVPSMVTSIEYGLSSQPEPNGWLIALGVVMFVGGIALSFFTMGAGSGAGGALMYGAAKITFATILKQSIAFVVSSIVSGITMDIGSQLIDIGKNGGTINDINWNSALVSGIFNTVIVGLGQMFNGLKFGWQVLKISATTILEGFTNYVVALTYGATQKEAWEAFAWGASLSLLFNSIEILGSLRKSKVANNISSKVDDLATSMSRSNLDDTASDLLQNADNGFNKIDDDSFKYLNTALPSDNEAEYFDLNNKSTNKKEFVRNGGNGQIEFNKDLNLTNANGELVTKFDLKNGVLDLNPISHDEVKISRFDPDNRYSNFQQAYQGFAEKWSSDNGKNIPKPVKDYLKVKQMDYTSITPAFVEKACHDLKYTIHETVNKTAMLIPTELHQKISHFGGIALYGSKSKMPKNLKNIILEAIKR